MLLVRSVVHMDLSTYFSSIVWITPKERPFLYIPSRDFRTYFSPSGSTQPPALMAPEDLRISYHLYIYKIRSLENNTPLLKRPHP